MGSPINTNHTLNNRQLEKTLMMMIMMMMMMVKKTRKASSPRRRQLDTKEHQHQHTTGPDPSNIRFSREKFAGTEYAERSRLARAQCVFGIPLQTSVERKTRNGRRSEEKIDIFVCCDTFQFA